MGKEPNEAILCVDDEAIILIHLTMMLRKKYGDRYRYERASSADDGLAIVDRLAGLGISVIVILSDWLMPGMSGDEFLRLIHARHPDIKAIIISGKVDDESLRSLAAETGLVGYLSKPIEPEGLYALIDGIERKRDEA
ncbi:MAG: response regulator [Spirochaetes bacterium]|nr:response regulator [Spirochaetota bacterium]MBU1081896.1 response regulator [Spirochaetota bacterium]